MDFVESSQGQELYMLHDNGFKLAETQAELTPLQRFAYLLAKDYHTDDELKKPPKGMNKGQDIVNQWS